ncbi:MAG: tetratricopeptide repeat protein [Nitrospinae bacterium]|nr:tetratricopeptide repeat protein [Nitrospinota bacterium]
MRIRGKVVAACCCAMFFLIAGCTPLPRMRRDAAPDTYFIEKHVEELEGQVSSLRRERDQLTRRLDSVERKLARLSEHPWLSSVGDNPLANLPAPTEEPFPLSARHPPPEDPSPKAPPLPPPPPAVLKSATGKVASVFSRLTKIVRRPISLIRERSADELFRLGRRHFEAGEIEAAVEKLELYLERTKDGKKADEALLLIGRAELARGRPMAAASSLSQLLERAPESPKRPEALYHAGESFHRLNDKVQALKRWKELEAEYPSHPLAAKARVAIGQMAAER